MCVESRGCVLPTSSTFVTVALLLSSSKVAANPIWLDGWRIALRRVGRLPGTTQAFRRAFLHAWITSGDHIRQEAGADFILAEALRILLPEYRGRRAVTLYRGEGARNWRYRCPSLSWTASRAVADAHARGMHSYSKGGSVVLKASVPPGAIIAKVPANEDRYGETEYLVDRRMLDLKTVTVVRRHAARVAGQG